MANYDIPYSEPEPEKTPEELLEIEKKKAESKREIDEIMKNIKEKYKEEPAKIISNKDLINDFANSIGGK